MTKIVQIQDGDYYAVPDDVDPVDAAQVEEAPDDWAYLSYDRDEALRIQAYYQFQDADSGADVCGYNDQIVKDGKREYLVVTDDEADKLWDQDLDNYIEDVLEIPDSLRYYFDTEKWKKDARLDGRAHSLARYDGHEYEEDVRIEDEVGYETITYYLYRQN